MRRLTTYPEVVEVLERLPALVRDTRRSRGLTLREAGRQAGVSFSTMHRLERGADCSLGNAMALLRWLDASQPVEASR